MANMQKVLLAAESRELSSVGFSDTDPKRGASVQVIYSGNAPRRTQERSRKQGRRGEKASEVSGRSRP